MQYVIGLVLGIVSSLIAVVIVEKLRMPRIEIDENPDILESVRWDALGGESYEFRAIRARIRNRIGGSFADFLVTWCQFWSDGVPTSNSEFARFIQPLPARTCSATIEFRRLSRGQGEPLPGEVPRARMPGRWAASVQPVPIEGQLFEGPDREAVKPMNQYVVLQDLVRLDDKSRIDIAAGSEEFLDIAMTRLDDKRTYGWTNTSFAHDGMHTAWLLPQGDYEATITLRFDGREEQGKVRFEVPEPNDMQAIQPARLTNPDEGGSSVRPLPLAAHTESFSR